MDWRHAEELLTGGRGVYGELKNLCVWVKDNGGMGSLYRSQHELVFVFKVSCNGHRNNVQLGRFGRNRSNVWRTWGQLLRPLRPRGQSVGAAPDGEAGRDGR